jgi:hypothetical protein
VGKAKNPSTGSRPRALPVHCTKADFARLLGCDAAMVSRWVAGDRLVMDGARVQVMPSLRRLLITVDPARGGRGGSGNLVGSSTLATVERLLAEATDTGAREAELQARIGELERELAIEREWGNKREAAAGFRAEDDAAVQVARLGDAFTAGLDAAIEARASGWLDRWVEELIAVEFYGADLAEYRAERAAEDDGLPDVIEHRPGNPGPVDCEGNPAPATLAAADAGATGDLPALPDLAAIPSP